MESRLNKFINQKISFQRENEILEMIEKIILKYFPIINDRIDLLLTNPTPALEIDFIFGEDTDQQKTQINFLVGTESFRKNVFEKILVDGYVSPTLIVELISIILKDHEIINSINRTSEQINLSFNVNVTEQSIKGISCGVIFLNLTFKCPRKENTLETMFNSIISYFPCELKKTYLFREKYQEYCNILKKEIVNKLTKEELVQMLSLLTQEEIACLIYNMPNELFLSLGNKYKDSQTENIYPIRRRIVEFKADN